MKISKKQLLKFEKAARRSASIASGGYDGRFGQRVVESKKQYTKLNKKEIFSEQTRMINKLNKIFPTDIFSNFVPNNFLQFGNT